MRCLAITMLATIVACGHGERPQPDAIAIPDALCGAADAGADQSAIRSAMLACGCCSEGETRCMTVAVATTGIVVDVTTTPGDPMPPSAAFLDCVRGKLIDSCLAGSAGQALEICQPGF